MELPCGGLNPQLRFVSWTERKYYRKAEILAVLGKSWLNRQHCLVTLPLRPLFSSSSYALIYEHLKMEIADAVMR